MTVKRCLLFFKNISTSSLVNVGPMKFFKWRRMHCELVEIIVKSSVNRVRGQTDKIRSKVFLGRTVPVRILE